MNSAAGENCGKVNHQHCSVWSPTPVAKRGFLKDVRLRGLCWVSIDTDQV